MTDRTKPSTAWWNSSSCGVLSRTPYLDRSTSFSTGGNPTRYRAFFHATSGAGGRGESSRAKNNTCCHGSPSYWPTSR